MRLYRPQRQQVNLTNSSMKTLKSLYSELGAIFVPLKRNFYELMNSIRDRKLGSFFVHFFRTVFSLLQAEIGVFFLLFRWTMVFFLLPFRIIMWPLKSWINWEGDKYRNNSFGLEKNTGNLVLKCNHCKEPIANRFVEICPHCHSKLIQE